VLYNVALAWAIATAIVCVEGMNEEALLDALRVLTRIGFWWFVGAWVARPLHDLARNRVTTWMLANRRYLGLSFAAFHLMHYPIMGTIAALRGAGSWWDEYGDFVRPNGGPIMLAITIMAATSWNGAQRVLGKTLWSLIHTLGAYAVWSLFFAVYLSRIDDGVGQPYTYVYLATLVLAMTLRLAMAVRRELRVLMAGTDAPTSTRSSDP